MIILIILIILLGVYLIYEPFIDIFDDYRGEHHIILWYNYNGKRKYINIRGSQQ